MSNEPELFELSWSIGCGEYEFLRREYMLFANSEAAERYWIKEEVEANLWDSRGSYDDHAAASILNRATFSDKEREEYMESAADGGRYCRCLGCDLVTSMYYLGVRYNVRITAGN